LRATVGQRHGNVVPATCVGVAVRVVAVVAYDKVFDKHTMEWSVSGETGLYRTGAWSAALVRGVGLTLGGEM
jgi:hypothetical protein